MPPTLGPSPTSGRLTQRAIDALQPQAGLQYTAWDGDVRGFGVRVSPAGAKTFILKYRLVSGRVRWATLGRVGSVLSLDEARNRARAMRGDVAKGDDPLKGRDKARGAVTVATVAGRFLESHVAHRRKPSTERLYRLAVDSHLVPTLGSVPMAELEPGDVARLHHRLRATPYMANRVLAVCSKLVSWAEQQGYRVVGSNPCRGLEKYPEQARQRYLDSSELARLGAALRVAERWQSISPSSVAIIRLLLLTGARVSEITTLRWAHVDIKGGVLNLPDSKTGRKSILLSPPAVDVFRAVPRYVSSPFVFPGEGNGARKGQHRVSLGDAWAKLKVRARLADVRLHDLRHSFASVAVSNKQTLPVIGALLGHSQPATTARYAHLQADPLRAASNETAATIATAMGRRHR